MRYDYAVPAVPETVILSGGGLRAVWCCCRLAAASLADCEDLLWL